MKTLLVSINSKFMQTSLAIRYLRAYNKKARIDSDIREFTINHDFGKVVAALHKEKADVYGFSTYIFNLREVIDITSDLKKLLPGCIIFCGGPEVSYEYEKFLFDNPQIDFVVRGEGEISVSDFLRNLEDINLFSAKKMVFDNSVPGVSFIYNGKLYDGPEREPICFLDEIPFPYEKDELLQIKDKILYYESSRGCPFNCSYCMSSLEKKVRSFSLSRVFSDLEKFLQAGVGQVKFVDRTFNYDCKRALEILKFICEKDNGQTSFHFEITASLLNDETLSFLETVRSGLFRFEIGIQSTNPVTLKAINRRQDYIQLYNIFNKLKRTKVHIHADLIAGLPYEDLESFKKSFNDAMLLEPDVLQLGFLKILKGTEIAYQDEHSYLYGSKPPYEILSSRYISFSELVFLKNIEELVELYYNSGLCRNALSYCISCKSDDYYSFYSGFSSFLEKKGFFEISHKTIELFDIFYYYVTSDAAFSNDIFAAYLAYDLYSFGKVYNPPHWLKIMPEKELMERYLTCEDKFFSKLPVKIADKIKKTGLRKWVRRMDIVKFDFMQGDPPSFKLFVYDGKPEIYNILHI